MPFPDQSCPCNRAVVLAAAPDFLLAAIELLTQEFQTLLGFALEPAVGELLNAVSKPGFEEAAIKWGRLLVEQVAPHLL